MANVGTGFSKPYVASAGIGVGHLLDTAHKEVT